MRLEKKYNLHDIDHNCDAPTAIRKRVDCGNHELPNTLIHGYYARTCVLTVTKNFVRMVPYPFGEQPCESVVDELSGLVRCSHSNGTYGIFANDSLCPTNCSR